MVYGKPWNAVSKTDLPVIEDIKELYKNETMNTKTPIGYKPKSEFLDVAAKLVSNSQLWVGNIEKFGIAFTQSSSNKLTFQELKVLDLWFDPVYEKPKHRLPVINTYKGEDKGDYLQYGCAKIPKEWFKDSSNRYIISLTLNSGVTLNKDHIITIRNYLSNV